MKRFSHCYRCVSVNTTYVSTLVQFLTNQARPLVRPFGEVAKKNQLSAQLTGFPLQPLFPYIYNIQIQ